MSETKDFERTCPSMCPRVDVSRNLELWKTHDESRNQIPTRWKKLVEIVEIEVEINESCVVFVDFNRFNRCFLVFLLCRVELCLCVCAYVLKMF